MKAEITERLSDLSVVSVLRDEGSALDKQNMPKSLEVLDTQHSYNIQRTSGVNLMPDSKTLGIKLHF
jgi:hypothetical protein